MCRGKVSSVKAGEYAEISGDGGGTAGRGGVAYGDDQNRGAPDCESVHHVLLGLSDGFQICQHLAREWEEITERAGLFPSAAMSDIFSTWTIHHFGEND